MRRVVPLGCGLCLLASLAVPVQADDVPTLAKQLRDPEFSVYIEAFNALEKLGPKAEAAVPALLKAVTDLEDRRGLAVHTLIAIGTPSVPGLTKLLKADSLDVRQQAATALVRIDVANEEKMPEVATIVAEMAKGKVGSKFAYSVTVKRVKLPDAYQECGLYYECENHYDSATKYFGQEIPASWWVYVYPNMYVWRDRAAK
jgi:hypothetical protein